MWARVYSERWRMVFVYLGLCGFTNLSLILRNTGSLDGGICNEVLFAAVFTTDGHIKMRKVCAAAR